MNMKLHPFALSALLLLMIPSCAQRSDENNAEYQAQTSTPNLPPLEYDVPDIDTTLFKGGYEFHVHCRTLPRGNEKGEFLYWDGPVLTLITVKRKNAVIYHDSTFTSFVNAVSVQDLDGDALPDLFFSTSSEGSGVYGDATVYCMNADQSFSTVSMRDQEMESEYGEGYQGHDIIRVVDNRVRQEFPVYAEGDPNCCPTNGSRVIEYRLVKNNGGRAFKRTSMVNIPPTSESIFPEV